MSRGVVPVAPVLLKSHYSKVCVEIWIYQKCQPLHNSTSEITVNCFLYVCVSFKEHLYGNTETVAGNTCLREHIEQF